MPAQRKLPEALQGRSFTTVDATAEGLSRRRSQGKDLFTPSRGIRVPWGHAQQFHEVLRPVIELTPGGFASFGTAARLWEISVPAWMEGEPRLHVGRTGTTAVERFGVVGHRLRVRDDELGTVEGVPVTSPARTWLDLASVLLLEDLVAASDSVVCAHNRSFGPAVVAKASLADLAMVVARHGRARGVRNARAALELVRVGVDSPPETYLRLEAGRRGLPEPDLDVVVVDASGNEVAWPDLAFPEYKVAVQYDGRHHLTAEQQESDARRDNQTVLAGWMPLRITGAMISSRGYEGAVALIRDALVSRGWVRSRPR
jgi:hypothetical protein